MRRRAVGRDPGLTLRMLLATRAALVLVLEELAQLVGRDLGEYLRELLLLGEVVVQVGELGLRGRAGVGAEREVFVRRVLAVGVDLLRKRAVQLGGLRLPRLLLGEQDAEMLGVADALAHVRDRAPLAGEAEQDRPETNNPGGVVRVPRLPAEELR